MGERNHPRSRRSGSDVTDARVRRENASKGCPTTGKRFRACVHRTSRHAHPNREMDDCGQDTIPRCGNRLGRLTAINVLQIRFNPEEDYVPVDNFHQLKNDPWTFWTHDWSPKAPGTYSIRLSVKEPTVQARRLDSGYYVRSVEIMEM